MCRKVSVIYPVNVTRLVTIHINTIVIWWKWPSLLAVLKDDDHQCYLEKTDDWNIVELIVNGECVYKCNITDLEFGDLRQHLKTSAVWMIRDVMLMKCLSNFSLLIGGDGRLDPRCQEAIAAVRDAYWTPCLWPCSQWNTSILRNTTLYNVCCFIWGKCDHE